MKTHYNSLTAAAEKCHGFGFKIIDGVPIADNNVVMEAQACIYFTDAELCYIVFVNAANENDYVVCKVTKENNYYPRKIEPKLTRFIRENFLQAVTRKNIAMLVNP